MDSKLAQCPDMPSFGHTSYDLLTPSGWVQEVVQGRTPSKGRVIDLGCGPGRHLAPIREMGMEAYGLDYSYSYLKRAAKSSKAKLVLGDMSALPFQNESVDTVLAWRSIYIQKLDRIKSTVSEIKRVLKQGGSLICACRSQTNTLHFVAQEIGQEIEPGTFHLNDGIDFFNVLYHFFSLEEIQNLFQDFHIDHITEIPLPHTHYTAYRPEYQNNFWVFIACK